MTGPSPEDPLFERVAIVGLGLVGGSLARALGTLPSRPEIRGFSRDLADLETAKADGTVDVAADSPDTILPGADLVVYATPLHAALRLVGEHRDRWEAGAVVTDVVGLKAPLLERMRELDRLSCYVGAHPMAGSERLGYGEADAGLFRGARVWLVHGGAPEESRGRVQALWARLGAVPRWTEAAEHDRSVVWCSHLPQILANALTGALDSQGFSPDDLGPGGRDMTRLAASPPGLWKDLFAASASSLGPAVASVSRALEVVVDLLQRRDVHTLGEFMEATRRWQRGLDADSTLFGAPGPMADDGGSDRTAGDAGGGSGT